jgi:protease I
MAGKLDGKRIAFLAAEGVEQVELTDPWQAVADAGGEAVLVSLEAGEVQAFEHLDKARTFPVDLVVADADAANFDALVVPGGVANPDFLRADEDAVAFVRGFFEQAKPVAAICHGPWVLVEAGVVDGRTLTSFPSIRTDIVNAGGRWVDEQVVVDQGMVTSRNPDDLPAFCAKLVEEICEGRHEGQARSVEGVAS